MNHWIGVLLSVLSILIISKATYQAGLKQFAYAIGVMGTLGWLLLGSINGLLAVRC